MIILDENFPDILRNLAVLCELSPDVRFGQLLANLGFLAEDMSDRTLWDIEDTGTAPGH
jgi:hypothetical protein